MHSPPCRSGFPCPMRLPVPGRRIVCLSSVSGLFGNREQVNYSAAKAGTHRSGETFAVELGKLGIMVNCVAPGLIASEMIEAHVPVAEILDTVPIKAHWRSRRKGGGVEFSVFRESRLYHSTGARRQRRSVLNRVVVTGMGAVTSFGTTWRAINSHSDAYLS